MKKVITYIIFFLSAANFLIAQNRAISRGAELGELYLTGAWYGIYNPMWGPPFYDTVRTAVYHITENGKKLTIQYDADYFGNPEEIMMPQYILADATPGVFYNKQTYSKNSNPHTALRVSFDFGVNWVFREENIGSIGYLSGFNDSIILRGQNRSWLESRNYGETFLLSIYSSHPIFYKRIVIYHQFSYISSPLI